MTDQPTGLPFDGLTVLVTGNIDDLSRDAAKAAITTLGGIAAPGVSAKVNLIVLGEGAGVSKTAKARMLGIPVLDGEHFATLAADPTTWDGQPLGMTWVEHDTLHADPDTNDRVAATPEDRAHWVAKAVTYVNDDETGRVRRQVRFICACGHRWMRDALEGDDACPRPSTPIPTGPWENDARDTATETTEATV